MFELVSFPSGASFVKAGAGVSVYVTEPVGSATKPLLLSSWVSRSCTARLNLQRKSTEDVVLLHRPNGRSGSNHSGFYSFSCVPGLVFCLSLHRPQFQAGDGSIASLPGKSLEITRKLTANIGEQNYIPSRFLERLIPAALLERYLFWQIRLKLVTKRHDGHRYLVSI